MSSPISVDKRSDEMKINVVRGGGEEKRMTQV